MKVLVVGSGAREHAIAWSFARSPDYASAKPGKERIFCAPGNAGTELVARNLSLDADDSSAIIQAVRELDIGLVIVGPETPLAAGLVDALEASGISAFGPPKNAARLESSKSFARSFAERHGIPCARTERFGNAADLRRFLDERRGQRIVLKKSGLAAGKGVLESENYAELAAFGEAVLASDELLAEEFLVGRELSVFAVCDGRDRIVLPACADHKKAGAGDTGPNTGGMGAVCPLPFADSTLMARLEREIVDSTFRGMEAEGLMYRGVLFFGIMLTATGPKLLEYNVRFGDPETQSLLPLLETSFLDLALAAAKGRLCSHRPVFSAAAACGVVVAAPGYPGSYSKGLAVDFDRAERLLDEPDPCSYLFHAATTRDPEKGIRTGGGRCFTAVGVGSDWQTARARAYELAESVRFEGAWYRPDIGEKVYRG